MSQTLRPRRSAPYELLARPAGRSLWGHLNTSRAASSKVATVFGAAASEAGRLTVWHSDPPEAARLAVTGQTPRRRGGVRGLFDARAGQVVVTRREVTESDVVIATILALHPVSASQWDPQALPSDALRDAATAAITHRRADGTPWRPASQADADAVATLLCAMAEAHRADTSCDDLLRELAAGLADDVAGARLGLDRLPDLTDHLG